MKKKTKNSHAAIIEVKFWQKGRRSNPPNRAGERLSRSWTTSNNSRSRQTTYKSRTHDREKRQDDKTALVMVAVPFSSLIS